MPDTTLHKEILSGEQLTLLPNLKLFFPAFGLVGGTAIALQLGHRKSIDFDFFAPNAFKNQKLLYDIKTFAQPHILVDEVNELTLMINNVKITFYHFGYPIKYDVLFAGHVKMPNLLDLASMKVFALGRCAKWKDYVDLYFLLHLFGLTQIVENTKGIFENEFSERMLREQLSYFEDINYSEPIEFMPGFEKSDVEIKQKLIEFALS